MGYAVELYFDEAMTARVAALTQVIFAQCGGADLAGMGFRPHISLATYETISFETVRPFLERLAAKTSPFTLALAATGVFPTEQGVVFLAPVVTPDLLHLHDEFSRCAEAAGLITHPYYRPSAWIPHCTVGHDVAPALLGEAVRLCYHSQVFGPANVATIGLSEYPPARLIGQFELAG